MGSTLRWEGARTEVISSLKNWLCEAKPGYGQKNILITDIHTYLASKPTFKV